MSSNNTLLILLLAGIILLIGSIIFLVVRESETPLEKAAETAIQNSEVRDAEGNSIVSSDSSISYLLEETSSYQIVYQKGYDLYLVSLNKPPIQETRKDAEEKFLSLFNGDTNVACELNVQVVIPAFVNSDLAGQILPLSFCK